MLEEISALANVYWLVIPAAKNRESDFPADDVETRSVLVEFSTQSPMSKNHRSWLHRLLSFYLRFSYITKQEKKLCGSFYDILINICLPLFKTKYFSW